KAQVKQAFKQLLTERKALRSEVRTQEEIAQKAQEQTLVNKAAQFTSDTIVKGLAELQLGLGNSISLLGEQLQAELTKLDELKSSIKVENARLQEILNIQLAADALDILKQEQTAFSQLMNETHTDKLKQLSEEQTQKRAEWVKELQEQELAAQEYTENLRLDREKELADYKYELDRTYKLDTDLFSEKRKLLERELKETETGKRKDWKQREKTLQLNQPKFDEYKAKVDASEQEISEAVKKAREEAIKDASREVKIKAELFEKEVEGSKQVYELQIKSLEETLAQQTSQVEKLQTELKEALAQVQSLSLKAIENTNGKGK
ncbi:MAG: hypothetical protein SFU25_09650, partial [Candidatus Caenarcaniphilales bacterium]|nr:hypothetical protein [Candidatus Caenarcaniphilales bacterium]